MRVKGEELLDLDQVTALAGQALRALAGPESHRMKDEVKTWEEIVMAWSFDIRDRMRPAHPGGTIPANLERYYWELNLMIHLLDGYTYGQMSGNTVGNAMSRFVTQVDNIQDSELSNPAQAKLGLKGTLTAIDAVMTSSHSTFTMYDLYTQRIPSASQQLVVVLFDRFQRQMGDAKTFPGGARARVCMPFLEWQRTGTGFPSQAVMNDFLTHFGNDSLRTLIDKSHASLSTPAKAAIANAKANGILITRAIPGPSPKTIEFDNQLLCSSTTNHCEPVPSGFCLTATDGTCSAMSG